LLKDARWGLDWLRYLRLILMIVRERRKVWTKIGERTLFLITPEQSSSHEIGTLLLSPGQSVVLSESSTFICKKYFSAIAPFI
jgi:hypothetical protein